MGCKRTYNVQDVNTVYTKDQAYTMNKMLFVRAQATGK